MVPLVTLLLLLRDSLALQVSVTSRSPAAGCRDAIPGEWCHSALVWARDKGARQHPDWFPGDAGQYTARDFQSLLHQVGSAQCPPPCPLGHAERRPPALGLLQTDAGKALNSQSHGFGGGELEEVMESTWAPRRARDMPAQASGPAAGALDADCEDASEGSLCHHSVTWLRESGFARHPEWYPGLSSDTSFEDVQMILHSLGKAECKKPCEHAPATYTAKQDDTDVLEVESTNGREMSGEEVVLAPPQSCGNTTTGDWCSISIQWLRDSGFGEHPDWYPGLSHESTDREIQAELHRQGKVGCPEPCQERRPDMTTTTSTVAPSCTDAEEGSACFDAVMAEIGGIDIKVALDELASTFRKVQERLYHSMKAGCTRPCAALHSQKVIDQRGYMKKPVEDMTMNEMKIYFDGDWDGMVPASTSRFAIPTQDTAEASTTEAVLSDDAAAENESEEALTYESAAEIAAENASSMEPMALQKASPEEIDADTYVASGPDESNNSVVIGPVREGSTFTTGRDGDGLVGRIVEGSTANRATETAAENASDLEPPAPEEHVAAEGVADAAAERSLPVPEVDAKLAAGEDEPLPYVDEDGVETSPAEEREDASQQAPHDAAWEGTVAGAILEASTNPDATSEADQLKAELEKLKAENDALKQSTELEKLRAENEALKRAAELKAENEALQQEQSNASQPAEEQRSSAADPAEEDGGVGQPADEQGGAVRPAEPAEAAPPAGERGGAGEPAPERGDAVHPVDKQVVDPEPMPMISTDEVLSPEETEESPEEMRARIRKELLKDMSATTTRAESPADVADEISEELLKEMSVSTTHLESPADVANEISEELLKEMSISTTHAETPAEAESRIREELLKAMTASYTAPETPVELERETRDELLKLMSVSTTPAETLAEKAKRMREELLKDISDITTPTETPAEVESMARDEFLKELAAETTAPETREEMKARMKAEMLRKLEEEALKEKQNMEADVRNDLHDELSKGTVDAMGE